MFNLYKFIFKINNDSVYYWKSFEKSDNHIPFQDTSLYYSLLKNSRSHLDSYYNKLLPSNVDLFLKNYFKKSISYVFSDYFSFRKAIEVLIKNSNNNYKIVGPYYLCNIYENQYHTKKNKNILLYIIFINISLLKIFKKIGICLLSPKKVPVPDIFFYRKKLLPDSYNVKQYIHNKYNGKFSLEVATLLYAKGKNKYSIVHLNHFEHSFKKSLIAFMQMLKFVIKDFKYIKILGVPPSYLSIYLYNSFDSLLMINLGFKVFSGIMEKPPFILLYRYKKQYQKIGNFGDSFIYPPAVHLDYVYADHYYSWNEKDIAYLNANGGSYDKCVVVGNMRSKHNSVSNGLSEDVSIRIKSFEKVILVTTVQIYNNTERTYYPFTETDLNKFINAINKIAKRKEKYLFIIKYKKGEYKMLEERVYNNSEKLLNVYPIYCDVPLTLQNNQFEDLLEKADLMISLCNWSTTIWQALAKKVPIIACNNSLPSSFLSDFKYLEVKYSELEKAVNHWMNMSKNDLYKFFYNIGSLTNIYKNGFELFIDDLVQLIKVKNNRK